MKFRCKTTGKIISWEPIMINASLVSAQNRKRLFWVGKLADKRHIGGFIGVEVIGNIYENPELLT